MPLHNFWSRQVNEWPTKQALGLNFIRTICNGFVDMKSQKTKAHTHTPTHAHNTPNYRSTRTNTRHTRGRLQNTYTNPQKHTSSHTPTHTSIRLSTHPPTHADASTYTHKHPTTKNKLVPPHLLPQQPWSDRVTKTTKLGIALGLKFILFGMGGT